MDHTTWTDQTLSASVEVVDQEAAATDIKTDEAAATDVPILMGMDLDVFNAAKEGKIDVLRGHDPQHLNQILTPTSNTVLHLVVVDLEHGAAAFALSSSAEEEAACWKIFIRTPSKEKDTALHQAVRFKHLGVVEILIKEDPDFSYPPNVAGETPLYLAAERRYKALSPRNTWHLQASNLPRPHW
ncbi:ankyrin-3-like [Prunus yedoensis var. nudiflora]|uniref:Ankyrin-3-like n=1 Tax=Prunus yedoensis var. nudiflora TaxID=2094558 RepID=A0A314UI18_PRUYE|nr:ankyrin-3-like [Prunus yedoensis var. nudiflora]